MFLKNGSFELQSYPIGSTLPMLIFKGSGLKIHFTKANLRPKATFKRFLAYIYRSL
jgi:hypothetical protein